MALNEKLITRIEELIAKGGKVLSTEKVNYYQGEAGLPFLEPGILTEWRTQSLSFLADLIGRDHDYYTEFQKRVKESAKTVRAGQGILRAVKEDLSDGSLLKRIRTLVSAEVFSDLLEQAEELQKNGYKDAAAVIIGAVLERHLRTMCDRSKIDLFKQNGNHKAINEMNEDLAKADAYSLFQKKQIIAWADIRNNAAHGKFDAYNGEDVAKFLRDVKDFCNKFS